MEIENKYLVIIFLLVLIVYLIYNKMHSGALVASIIIALYLANDSLYKICAEAFHMSNEDQPSALYLEDNLDGGESKIHYHADRQHQAVLDRGDGFIPIPDLAGGYFGDDEDQTDINSNEYPTPEGVPEPNIEDKIDVIQENNAIKAKYDPDISQFNSGMFHDGGNRKLPKVVLKLESPSMQEEIPTRIDNEWLNNTNKEVEYDNDYVTENMVDIVDSEHNDPWLRRQKFASQNIQNNEYFNSLSKVDVWREDTLERFGNSHNVPSWPTQYNPSDNWDAY